MVTRSPARLLGSPLWFWLILLIPSIVMLRALLAAAAPVDELLHPSGEVSALLLIAALMLTPLSLLLRGARWTRWLIARRRAIGVAAFAYALLHLVFYVIEMGNLDDMLAEISALGIWTGWAALFVMLPLALTSSDSAMRALGRRWKSLQRLAYAAALLTLVHWMFVHNNKTAALLHFAPLLFLQLYRLLTLPSTKRMFA